jgi:FMN phosphatase YigB (HAD superfamily)
VGDRVREDYEGPTRLGMRAVILTAHSSRAVPEGVPTVSSLAAVLDLL